MHFIPSSVSSDPFLRLASKFTDSDVEEIPFFARFLSRDSTGPVDGLFPFFLFLSLHLSLSLSVDIIFSLSSHVSFARVSLYIFHVRQHPIKVIHLLYLCILLCESRFLLNFHQLRLFSLSLSFFSLFSLYLFLSFIHQ